MGFHDLKTKGETMRGRTTSPIPLITRNHTIKYRPFFFGPYPPYEKRHDPAYHQPTDTRQLDFRQGKSVDDALQVARGRAFMTLKRHTRRSAGWRCGNC